MVLVFFPIVTYLFAVYTVMGAPASPLVSFTERSLHNVGSVSQFLCNKLLKPLRNIDICSKALGRLVDPTRGVNTPYGVANGDLYRSGVVRFAVKYATASRWQAPVAVRSWTMP